MTAKTIRVAMTGPAEVVDLALDCVVRQYGWADEVLGSPNPQTKEDKAREVLFQFVLDTVAFYQRRVAEEQAAAAAAAAVAALVPLTQLTLAVEQDPE